MGFSLRENKQNIVIFLIAAVSFLIGMLMGHLVTPSGMTDSTKSKNQSPASHDVQVVPVAGYQNLVEDKWKNEKEVNDFILKNLKPEKIKENLRYLSEKPHLAASLRDVELAHFIQGKFEAAGFDSSELVSYNLYLSKANQDNPNKITLTENGKKIFESNYKEIPIHPDDNAPDFIHAFNAYTPAVTVLTEPGVGVVYVNYGRIKDFEDLQKMKINVTGHIVMARYGKIYRGNKVKHAAIYGAKGVIIFSDPNDVALEGTESKDVYDHTFWLPGTGIQRGSTYLGMGDPLTPGWPSTDSAYRLAEEEAELHKIPSQPIGYADAREILSRLGGDSVPKDWQGGLPGIDYKFGPAFNSQNGNVSLTLSTHNVAKIEQSYNVIGIIKGSIEPDRYVLIGNHRDAWGFGASDPSSGTAQLLETVRVYGLLLLKGWRPRRSLVFCSWGAEEFGLLGSTEWVEENVNKLQDRAVAYINTDTCVGGGPTFQIRASALLHDMFYDITKLIPGVQDPSKTIFDEWMEYSNMLKPEAPVKPIIKALGSGSDFAPFSSFGAIPAGDISFQRDKTKYNISIYPYYHTGYETFHMVSTLIDPDFKIHQGCARVASLSLKYLADASILPYSIHRLPELMVKSLKESEHKETLMKIYDKYSELKNSVDRLIGAVKNFKMKIKDPQNMSPMKLRAINDQMMHLEQIFILPESLPGRPGIKNAAFAPNQFDKYSNSVFPAISDLLHNYTLLTPTEKIKKDKMIKRHVSDLTIMVDRASSYLKEVHLI